MSKAAFPLFANWAAATGVEKVPVAAPAIVRLSELIDDDMDDSSLDTANFGVMQAASGTVVETTELTMFAGVTADVAGVYNKNILNPRATNKWTISVKHDLVVTNANNEVMTLWQGASVPAASGMAGEWGTGLIAGIWQKPSAAGEVQFIYTNTGGTRQFWNGSAWQSGNTYFLNITPGTTYVAKMINDGTTLTYEWWNADETTLLGTASIAWSSIRAEANDLYAIHGYPRKDQNWSGTMNIYHYNDNRHLTTSPVLESPWIPVDQGVEFTSLALFEDSLATINGTSPGNIRYQYATNGGAYNGSWVTLAAMQAALVGVGITDTVETLRIKAQFNSDGTTNSDLILGEIDYVKSVSTIAAWPEIGDWDAAAGIEKIPATDSVAARLAKTTEFTDDFDDASFDTTLFGGPVTSNGGTVTEAGGVVECDTLGAQNETGFFWIKAALDTSKTFLIETRFRFTSAFVDVGAFFGVNQEGTASTPQVANRAIAVYSQFNPNDSFYFSRWDAGGSREFWKESSPAAWQAGTDEDIYRPIINTWYTFKLYGDGTSWWMEIWDGDNAVPLVASTKVTWADTYAPGGSYYFYLADFFTTAGRTVIEFDYVTHTVDDYSTSSPVIEAPWLGINGDTIDDLALFENAIASITGDTPGTLKWQAALNGGAYGAGGVDLTPDSVTVNTGSIDSGTVADLGLDDGMKMIFSEVNGAPGWSYDFIFSPSTAPDTVAFNGHYAGNPAHITKAQMWDFNNTIWVDLTVLAIDLPSDSSDYDRAWSVPSPNADYISGGESRVRLIHSSNGNVNHKLNVDLLTLHVPSAVWLDLVDLKATVIGTVITDTTQTIRVKAQLNSDGTTRPDITIASSLDFTLPAVCDYPVVGDVRLGTIYNNTLSTGTLALPAIADVEAGVQYGEDGTEFTGTFGVPAVADVESGVQYGGSGTEFTGTLVQPAVGDVEAGVQYGGGGTELTGTFGVPTEAQVEDGVGYGEDDTEFTGTFEGGVTFVTPLEIIDLTVDLEVIEL